ncbi:hypothetical protein [Nocardia macrotermitis]|uniref:Uncharacterized protein n=1 Tax=Nocardia macrotermitis TaxID=2585198 RepID=A0A7K0D620_9NOCA|nr:hypothetical protein [Nocardia macrotermitis]MQY20284.1 hypothetical protein [Nocardia macrotermitis]
MAVLDEDAARCALTRALVQVVAWIVPVSNLDAQKGNCDFLLRKLCIGLHEGALPSSG